MATFLRYFISGTNADLLELGTPGSEYTLTGQQIVASGSGTVNTVHAALGVDLDVRNLLAGEDVVVFNYRWDQYTKDISSVSGAIVFSYTDTGTGLTEKVTVSNGGTTLGRDKLIFADGAVLTQNARTALTTSLTALVTAVTGYDPLIATPSYVLPTPAGNTLYGFGSTDSTLSGATFAMAEAGQTLISSGTGQVDKVYVKAGSVVDARNLLAGEDLIYLAGNWADYTKSLTAVSGAIQFTRTINGQNEVVTVSNGATTLGRDKLVFADGAVLTQNARTALTTSLTAAISAVTGYDAVTVTPFLSDIQSITITSTPGPDNTYTLGDTIEFTVTMKAGKNVDVSGAPQLSFMMGTTPVTATLLGTGNNLNTFKFTHQVQANENDANGISVGANAISLNGGHIYATGSTTTEAKITNSAGTDQATHMVDTIAPTISTAVVSGTDSSGVDKAGTLVAGDKVKVVLTSLEAITGLTTGDKVVIDVGGVAKNAFWVSSSGNNHTFSYTILANDLDTASGISLTSLTLAGAVTDTAGNALTTTLPSQTNTVVVDALAPTISAVTIPNVAMKVGDVVTATITVSNATGETLTLAGSSNTIGGFTVGALTKVNDTTYTATFTVAEAGADVAAGTNIPVSLQLKDAVNNTSSAYITAISQAADAIDANSPSAPSMALATDSAAGGGTNTDSLTKVPTVNVGGVEASATWQYEVDGNGTWVTGTGSAFGLTEGSHSYKVRQTDSSGNLGTASSSITYNLDTHAPTVTAASVSGTDSGGTAKAGTLVAGDKIVVTLTIDDSTAAVTGTPSLSILLNGTPKTATFVSKTGSSLVFSYTVLQGDNNPGSITLGALTQSAGVNSVDDTAGNAMVLPTGITVTGSVAVDASALTTTAAITTVTDNVGVNTATAAAIAGYQNTSTDDSDLLIAGTFSATDTITGNYVLAVYDGTTRKGTATVDNVAHTWTYQTGTLTNGTHGLTVRVENAVLNQNGPYSSAFNINVEGSGVSLTNIISDSGTTIGAIAQRGITADTMPTLGGVLGAKLMTGEKVGIYQDGARVADATLSTDGVTWSYTPGAALAAGKHTYVVKVDDGTSANVRMEMPATLSGVLGAALTMGQKVGIYRTINSVETRLGDATVGSDGLTWTYTPSAAAGAAAWDVRVDDGTSHGGANTVATYDYGRVVIIDNGTPPSQTPVITSVTDNVTTNTSVQGALTAGTSTDDSTLALAGTVTALTEGQVLAIYKTVGGITTKLGNASVIGTAWTYTTPALSAGDHTLKAVVEGGGSGVQGTPATFAVKVQTLATTAIIDDVGLTTGSVAASASTDDARPTITGTLGVALGSNEEIGIYDGTTYKGAATVTTASNGSLSWSYTPGSDLSLGAHTLKAVVQATSNTTIANGEVITAGNTFTVVGPAAPLAVVSGITVADDVASNTFVGNLVNNSTTNDTQLKLTIALNETAGAINAAAGDVVQVFDGTQSLGNATLNGANWELNTAVLPTGTHSFTAKVTNTGSGLSSTSTATTQSINVNSSSSAALSVETGSIVVDGGVRYIKLAQNGTLQYVDLNEIQVMSGGVNVALNQTVTSNKIFSTTSLPLSALTNGVLGATNANDFAETTPAVQTTDLWVQVDLGGYYAVDSISVYPRNTPLYARANNLMVFASGDDMSSQTNAALQANSRVTTLTTATSFTGQTTPLTYTSSSFPSIAVAPTNVLTDDTPTLSGVLATALLAGEKVAIYKNSTYVADATMQADGKTWIYTSPTLVAGSYTFGAKVTNGAAGVEGSEVRLDASIVNNALSSFKVVAAPSIATLVNTLTVNDDLASSTITGAVATGTSTNDTTPTYTVVLNQALTGNQRVQFSVDGTVVSTDTALTYTPTVAQTAGAHTVSAKVVDVLTQVSSAPQSSVYQIQQTTSVIFSSDTGVVKGGTRYIMLAQTTSSYFDLNEIQVMSGGVNVALNQTVTSNKIFSTTSLPLSALTNGVLGATNAGDFAETTPAVVTSDLWVQVDLGGYYAVDSISLLPRNSPVFNRANGLAVFSSSFDMSATPLATLQAGASGTVTYHGITAFTDQTTAVNFSPVPPLYSADDLTPTLSGTLSAALGTGESLAVFVGGTEVGGATFNTSGLNWSVTLPAQTAGSKAIEVRLVDSANHATVKAVVGSQTLTLVDPSVVGKTIATFVVSDDVGTQQGSLTTGSSTDDSALSFSGTVSAALGGSEVVRVYDGATLLGNATMSGLNFSYTPTSSSSFGAHSFSARVENTGSGVQGSANTVATAVNAIAITSYNTANNTNVDDGKVRYIKVRQNASVSAFAMTLGEVEVYSGGVNIARGGSVSVSSTGANAASVVNGITDSITDGFTSGSSTAQWVQIDLGAYYKVDSVKLYSEGTNTPTGTNNLVVFASKDDLTSLSYYQMLANTGTSAGHTVFNLGTTSGATTTAFSQSFNGPGISIGSITPTLSGTLATALLVGEKLMVQIDSGTAVDITSSLSGLGWSYAVTGQTAGAHTFKVSIQDSGNSQTRVLRSETINLLDPAEPNVTIATLKATDDVALSTLGTGILTASGSTDDTKPALSGTLSAALGAGQAVQVWDTYQGVATLLGTATISGAGSTDWAFAFSGLTLASGVHNLSVKAVNLASGAAAAPQTISLAVGALGSIGVVADTGLVSNSNGTLTTVDTTPTLTGTLAGAPQAGEQVAVYIGGVFKGVANVSTTAAGSSWSFTPTTLSLGSYDVRVQVENASTHATYALQTGTIQVLGATPTATVTGILVSDAVGSTSTGYASYTAGDFTGTVAAGTSTNDTKPVVSGTLSVPLSGGEVVQVFDGTTYLGNASVAGSSWTYTVPNALSLGSHTLSARVTNPASGNSSTSVVGSSSVAFVENSLSVPVFSTNGGALVGGPAVRYVMVRQDGTVNQAMWLSEVEIYANGVNVARNAGVTVVQNPGGTYYSPPSNAVDGVYSWNAFISFDANTDKWIQVDLGAYYYIDSVKLNSVDNFGSDTLNHLTVFASSSDMASRTYASLQADTQVRNLGTTSGVPVNVSSSTTLTTSPLALSTADDTPTLNGALGAALGTGEKLMLQVDSGTAVDITSSLSGLNWTYTPGSGLGVGNHTFKAQVVRADGTVEMAQSQAINILSGTPTAGVSSLVVTDAVGTSSTGGYANGDRTGTVSANTSLNDSKPVISGTLGAALAQGEVVQVFDGNGTTLLGQATVTGTTWSYTPTTALAVGSHTLTAKVTNLSSGASNATVATQTVLVNSLTVGGVTALTSGGAIDGVTTGGVRYVLLRTEATDLAGGVIYEVQAFVGGVNVALNKPVSVFVPDYQYGAAPKFVTDGNASGGAYYNPGNNGTSVQWVQVDLGQVYASVDSIKIVGGNTGKLFVSSQDMSAYTNALLTAGVAGATYLGVGNTGTQTFTVPSTTQLITTDNTPQLSGTLAAGLGSGERLGVYVDGSYMGNATVATGSKTWTYTTSALPAGSHAAKVQLETTDGSTVIMSESYSFTVATATMPTAVVNGSITVTDDVGAASANGHTGGDATGAVAIGTSSDDALPTLSGTLSAALSGGQVVRVYDGSSYLGNAVVNGTSWTFQTASALAAGSHTLSAAVYTADGKTHSTSTATGGSLVVNSLGISSVTADTVGTSAVGGVRYLMVRSSRPYDAYSGGYRPFGLNELEVISGGSNVAAGKFATAFAADGLTSASKAASTGYVGVTDGVTTAPTLNHTNAFSRNDWNYVSGTNTFDGWVQVDLGGYYNLSKVNLYAVAQQFSYLDRAYVYASAQDMSGQTAAALQSGAAGALVLNNGNPLSRNDVMQTVTVKAQAAITTNDTTPVINGTLGAALGTNERVAVYVDGVYKANATVSGSGSNITWTATLPTQGLGSHTVTVQIEDSGSSIVKMAQTQTINVIASAAPTSVVNTLTVGDDLGATSLYGYSNGDGTGVLATNSDTNDTTPTLSGTLSAALGSGDVVQVYGGAAGTTLLGLATVNGTNWTYTPHADLAVGSYQFSAKVTNLVSNQSSTSTAAAVTTVVNSLSAPALTVNSGVKMVDTGAAASTQVRYVMVAKAADGTAFDINELSVMSGGVNVAATVTNNAAVDGKYSRSAYGAGVAAQGSDGVLETTMGYGADATTVTAGKLLWVQVDLGGLYAVDAITLKGSGTAGMSVFASAHSMQAMAGNTTALDTLKQTTVGYSTVAGSVTTLAELKANPNVMEWGTVATGATQTTFAASTITDTTPTITGTLGVALGSADVLMAYVDGATTGVQITPSGLNWTYTPTLSTLGSHTVKVQIEDSSTHAVRMAQSQSFTLTELATQSVSTIGAAVDGAGNGGVQGMLSAALQAGQQVGVYDGSVLLGYASTTPGSASFSYSFTGMGLGAHNLTAKVVNYDGTLGSGAVGATTVTVAGSTPTQRMSFTAEDSSGREIVANSGNAAVAASADGTMGNVTADTTPTFVGRLSSVLGSGETIEAYADGVLLTGGTLAVSGLNWTYTTPVLGEGNHDITFHVKTAGGVTGLESSAFRVNVDAVVANKATIDFAIDDKIDGGAAGLLGSGATTDDGAITLNGHLDFAQAGRVLVYDNLTLVNQFDVGATSNWSTTLALGTGPHSLTAKFQNGDNVLQTATPTAFTLTEGAESLATTTSVSGGVTSLSTTRDHQLLDLTRVTNTGVDKVDLGTYGGEYLKLNVADVLQADTNLFNAAGSWSFSNANDNTNAATYHQFMVAGASSSQTFGLVNGAQTLYVQGLNNNVADSYVDLTSGTSKVELALNSLDANWALTGTASKAGSVYNVYTSAADAAQLLVDQRLEYHTVF
jgi:hypothetical protein